MPRIEIIPTPLKAGDASPSVDACQVCAGRFSEGSESIPSKAISVVLDQGHENAESFRVGSIGVEHPSYNAEYAECVLCGEVLTALDD
jgi:hypothetical protein